MAINNINKELRFKKKCEQCGKYFLIEKCKGQQKICNECIKKREELK